jgi:RNA polymerase sigma-70 factor (ECF subfamily)
LSVAGHRGGILRVRPRKISLPPPSEIDRPNDDGDVSSIEPASAASGTRLLSMYERALPQVYGYLSSRTSSPTVAEDLTSETFLAAADAVKRAAVPDLTVAWLITVARNKLVDHWRREERDERRKFQLLESPVDEEAEDDTADERFERARVHAVLTGLGAHHRAALTLRYLDGLSVPEVADHLGRTVHATEALLVRARRAFRACYHEGTHDDR